MQARNYVKEISTILNSCPRELLLVLKTNDCLRTITNKLGNPLDQYWTTARVCARSINEARVQESPRDWRVRLQCFRDWLRVEAVVRAGAAAAWWGAVMSPRR